MIEFISYDGRYPNLCRGELTIKIDDKEVHLHNCLRSGGCCGFYGNNWHESYVNHGPWSVSVPDEYKEYIDEITKVVNHNIPWGCCGGCI